MQVMLLAVNVIFARKCIIQGGVTRGYFLR